MLDLQEIWREKFDEESRQEVSAKSFRKKFPLGDQGAGNIQSRQRLCAVCGCKHARTKAMTWLAASLRCE